MGQSGASAGLQCAPLWVVQRSPRGPAGFGLSARDGAYRSGRTEDRKNEALSSVPPGISAICPASYAAGPRGAREALCRYRLPRGSEGTRSICCEYIGERCGGIGIVLSACATVRLRSGVATAGQSSFSQLKLSENRRKQFHFKRRAHCVQRRLQRFPTVRTVGEIGNGEVRAKMPNIRACASTAM